LLDCDKATPALEVIRLVDFGIFVNERDGTLPPSVGHFFGTFRTHLLFVQAGACLATQGWCH
jgi:hypothetical protein